MLWPNDDQAHDVITSRSNVGQARHLAERISRQDFMGSVPPGYKGERGGVAGSV